MKKVIILLCALLVIGNLSATQRKKKSHSKKHKTTIVAKKKKVNTSKNNKQNAAVVAKDSVKKPEEPKPVLAIVPVDTAKVDRGTYLMYKDNAHASYYANKFTGRKTASGKRFNNESYTAAHKKLPFGTKVKVTNKANGKSIVVEITDRGPFVKFREIDLSRRAFMDITSKKGSGQMMVTLEVLKTPVTARIVQDLNK